MKIQEQYTVNMLITMVKAPLHISRISFLISVVLVALLMRLGLVGFVGQIRGTQMYEPLQIAKNITTGYGFSLHWQYESSIPERHKLMEEVSAPPYGTTFIPPIVPYIYSSIITIMGWNDTTLFVIMIVQAFIGALLPFFVYYATLQFFDDTASRYAAILSLLYFPVAMTAITFSGSVLYSLFGVALLWSIGKMRHAKTSTYFFVFGVVSGLLSLTRSEWYYIFFILVAIIVFYRSIFFEKPYYARKLSVAVLMFFMTTGWWTIRNYQEFGRIIPVTGHPWREMWRGFNLYSTGSGTNAQGLSIWEHRAEYEHIRKQLDAIPMDVSFEEKADQIYKNEVLTFWRQHPSESIVLMIKKIVMLWTIDIYYDKANHVLYIFPQLLLCALIFIGYVNVFHKDKRSVILWGTLFVCLSSVFSLTYILPRYQSYIFPMFLPLCGHAIQILYSKIMAMRLNP